MERSVIRDFIFCGATFPDCASLHPGYELFQPIHPVASADANSACPVLPRQRRHRPHDHMAHGGTVARQAAGRKFEDRVARVRRAGLDDMRKRIDVSR